ncbi:MAG: DUF4476 domain-containing protein [Ferruginibacter sp.]
MKSLFTSVICLAMTLTTFSQTIYNTVTVNFNGQNRQVQIDGKIYSPSFNDSVATNSMNTYNLKVTATDITPGRHVLKLVRNNNRRTVETVFTTRANYDMAINVDANGSIQLKETYRKRNTAPTGVVPISTASYNLIANNVKTSTTVAAKVNVLNTAFSKTSNYFTTAQAKKLIQMVSGESVRLQLAKSAIRGITDTRNIYSLNSVFETQASRNEFAEHIKMVNSGQSTTTSNTYTFKSPMSETNFTALSTDIRNRWQPGAKMSAISNAFAMTNAYFTTTQAIQLIQMVSSENERLQLAKASYKTIVDQPNFSQVYELLGTQSGRDDLSYYIRTNGGNSDSVPPVTNTTSVKTPMTDANFSIVLDETRRMWLPGAKKSAVLNLFANSNNYFTTSQAMQLIQLDNDEPDRFDMAKASYKNLVDPQSFSNIYSLFTTQSYINELSAFLRTMQ